MHGTNRPAVGRPARIDREKIIRASLKLGIDQLSMHAVARALNVSTTALYRHVKNRDELLNLCMDVFCERISIPKESSWRAYLEQLALEFRAAMRALPGAADYGLRIGPSTPAAYRIVDHSLGVLRSGGFAPADAWFAYSAVLNLTFDSMRRLEQYEQLIADHGGAEPYAVLTLEDSELVHLPNLAWSFGRPLRTPDEQFRESLDCLLGGIAARFHPSTSTPIEQ